MHIPTPRSHARNRSLSEYVPPPQAVLKPASPPTNGAGCVSPPPRQTVQNKLHREEYLAVQRGITLPRAALPTPPSTGQGVESIDTGALAGTSLSSTPVYLVTSIRTQQPRRYRMIRQLGRGTFSQVVLAVREFAHDADVQPVWGFPAQPRLVAVKVVEHGPAGGADQERVEVSLQREVEILKSINHPSIVQLKAFGSNDKTALLVLDYCPGGDLFEVASQNPRCLTPPVVCRMFAELVAAVRYLHDNLIVHRDIKLESEFCFNFYPTHHLLPVLTLCSRRPR